MINLSELKQDGSQEYVSVKKTDLLKYNQVFQRAKELLIIKDSEISDLKSEIRKVKKISNTMKKNLDRLRTMIVSLEYDSYKTKKCGEIVNLFA